MLCPELIKFPIPSYNINCVKGSESLRIKTVSRIKKKISSFQICRMLSFVVPANERMIVEKIANGLESGSCSLYLVRKFPLSEMVREEFLEAFVKRGKFYGISANTRLETDDCASISPDGTLLLSLTKDTYHQLKLHSSSNVRKRNKYVIKIDLNSPVAKEQLKRETFAVDMIVRWIPPDIPLHLGNNSGMLVSPRSLELYLQDLRNIVVRKLLSAGSKFVKLAEMSVPLLENNSDQRQNKGQIFCTADELIEYIGLLALDCDIEPKHEYLSTYSINGCTKLVDATWVLHQQGLFTPEEVEKSLDQLLEFMEDQQSVDGRYGIPWVALHVQGFSNALHVPGTKECSVMNDHDSAYTIIIGDHGDILGRSLIGCNGKGFMASEYCAE